MRKKKADEIIKILSQAYPEAKPQLNFTSCYELLIAVILSAQCTDKRVNIVTSELFKEYNTPTKMLSLSVDELGEKIKPCGLYHSKAKHILSATKDIIEKFGGEVPDTVEKLKTLDGVGQKTANVVYSVWFMGDAIAVDTHVFRLANRIGIGKGKTVKEVEAKLCKIIDKDKWSKSHHYLIWHGRNICKAINPNCDICPIQSLCEKNGVNNKK